MPLFAGAPTFHVDLAASFWLFGQVATLSSRCCFVDQTRASKLSIWEFSLLFISLETRVHDLFLLKSHPSSFSASLSSRPVVSLLPLLNSSAHPLLDELFPSRCSSCCPLEHAVAHTHIIPLLQSSSLHIQLGHRLATTLSTVPVLFFLPRS